MLFVLIQNTNKDKDKNMPRIFGVDIPEEKRTEVALTYIYGIGRKNVHKVLQEAAIDPDKRARELSDKEILRLQRVLDKVPIEGVLRKIIQENIKRLGQINCYRGLRHKQNLPVRGQRTRTNARTKRGKRMTIGALRKEAMQKTDKAGKTEETVKADGAPR